MTPFRIALLTCKVLAARWLRLRFELSDSELDAMLAVSADVPELRWVFDDVLAARR